MYGLEMGVIVMLESGRAEVWGITWTQEEIRLNDFHGSWYPVSARLTHLLKLLLPVCVILYYFQR